MDIDNIQNDVAYFSEHEEAKGILKEISSLSNLLLYNNNVKHNNSVEIQQEVLTELISKINKISEIITKYMIVEVLLYQYIEDLIGDIFIILRRFIVLPTSKKLEVVRRDQNYKSNSLIVLENLCYYLYIISKCVGIRRLINYAPNDVSLFEKITETIEMIHSTNVESLERPNIVHEDYLWCLEFIFLAWESLLVYTPFELNTIWKHTEENITFQERILTCSMYYLNKPTKARDGAAMVISNLFSRKDVLNSNDFHFFLKLCQDVLTNPLYISQLNNSINSKDYLNVKNPFNYVNDHLPIGVLTVLKQILKRVPSSDLIQYLDVIEYCLLNCENITADSSIRKLRSACLGRLAIHFLPPQETSQKYRKKCRKIFTNDSYFDNKDNTSGNINEQDPESDIAEEIVNRFDTSRVEVILGKILESLVDKDIRVRWACAKSVGRITARLPMDMNEDILDHIIESINSQFILQNNNLNNGNDDTGSKEPGFQLVKGMNLTINQSSTKSESVIHGGCLAIAEILRKGLIHPHMLDKVLDTTILTLSFEVWRGKGSAGSAVRDASCFICWAIARTFTKEMLSFDHISRICRELVNVSLFDSSVNCRRAACSALQELLGRIGTVPNGLDLIQMCNYYTVSNRKKAFVEVCQNVSTLNYYSNSMLQNLITTKLFHPDINTRELASIAIYKILSSTPQLHLSYENNYPNQLKEEKDEDNKEESANKKDDKNKYKSIESKDKNKVNLDNKDNNKTKGINTIESTVNYLIDFFMSNLTTGSTATTHGSLRALTKLMLLVIEKGFSVKPFYLKVLKIPITFERKRLFRGKGSNIIRQSICKLITANCKLILHTNSNEKNLGNNYLDNANELIDVYTIVLKDCLRNFALEVQLASVEAFEQMFLIIEGCPKFVELLGFLFNSLTSKGDHIAARRGYALAFSSVPISNDNYPEISEDGQYYEEYKNNDKDTTPTKTKEDKNTLYKDQSDLINKMLRLLCNEIKSNVQFEIVKDAKTRQFALLSLLSILTKLDKHILDKEVLKEVVDTLTDCCNDYEVDVRGDVGSWVRELSSEAIAYVLEQYLFKQNPQNHNNRSVKCFKNMDKNMTTQLTGGLISLSLENLEHVRSRSTFLFCHLFMNKLHRFNFTWVWNRIFYNIPYEHLISYQSNTLSSNAKLTNSNSINTALSNETSSTIAPTEINGINEDILLKPMKGLFNNGNMSDNSSSKENREVKGHKNKNIDNKDNNKTKAINGVDHMNNKKQSKAESESTECMDDVDKEIQMYIDERNEIDMYINIDNKLLEGFNMLHDISRSLMEAINQYNETEVRSQIVPINQENGQELVDNDNSGNFMSNNSYEDNKKTYNELMEYCLIGTEKTNVVLRIPGWSVAPLTFKTFLWVLLIPSYTSLAFKSLLRTVGQNMKMMVKIHSNKRVLILEDIFVEFISQNKDTLIGWNNKPKSLEQALKECSLEFYKETIETHDVKNASKLVNTLNTLFSHKLLRVIEWTEVIDIMINEAKIGSNYAYLKSIIRCLQVLLMDDLKYLSGKVLQTVLWFLNHQYPTIRSYVASNLSMTLSTLENKQSQELIQILDSCSFQVETKENIEITINKLRKALRI